MSRLRSAMMVAVAVVLACASVVAAMPPVPYFSQCDSRWSNDGIYVDYSGGVVSAEDVSEDFTGSVADAKIQARFAEDKIQSLSSQTEIFVGQGFDKCEIPTLSQMQNWITNSPYGAVNLYIGGSCRSCPNSALTASYISQLSQQGWKFIPTWVGPQSACWGGSCGSISNDPATAYNQGISEANAAIDVAIDLGLALADGSGTIIYYDLEGYDTTNTACRNSAKSFISGWTAQLHARGSEAGVYGSACGSAISDFASISNVPDAIWPAHWIYSSYNSSATVWDVACLSNGIWGNHQRIRQYAGGHDETWGGVTLNIDCNVIDGIVASVGTANSIPLSGNLSGTGDINGTFNSSTAEFTFNGKTVNFGTTTDLPVIGDWDGDGKDEIGVYRPDTGGGQSEFHLVTRDWDSLLYEVGDADKVIPFGYYPSNIPIAGDWDGDGDDDIGGFNPGNNKFYLYILNLGTSSAISYRDVPFGVSGDKPIIGDWDGDGDCDVGVYREYDSDYSSNLLFYFDLDLGGDQADLTPAPFGVNGDVAVIGDWDDDGDDDVGLYRAEDFIIDPDLNVPHDLVYLDNGIVKVGVDLEWGGAISVLMHQGMNLIDNHDTGRLAQVAFYDDDSGTWDPVQGGDVFNQGSPVLEYNAESDLIYTKTHPRDWKTGVLTDTHVEQWVSLEGESVKVRYKFTHFGTDTYTFHDQEFPCAYINSRLYRLITYTDGAPWTDGGISEFSIPQTEPGTPNTEFYPTEYWASFVNDSDFGLTLYSPDHTPKWAAHRFTIDTEPSYLVTIDQFTIEPGTVEEATEYFIVGNYPDARSIVYSIGLNQLPTAIIDSIMPNPAKQGTDTVSFTGHGTDSDGSIVAYNWRSSIDGQLSTSGSFSKPASDLSDGVHTIYYKVRDDNHSWSTEDTETLAIHLSGTDVITVDDDGPADYDNIQDAVDAAGTGDIIYVYNGTYNEHVTISESLTLLGQNESDVIIDGGGSGDCVQISSSDVAINGFTVTNASRYGIYASSSDLSIEHVMITGNGNYGIYFNSGKGFTLRDSTIDGNGGGINYNGYAADDAVVENNIITNNIGYGMAINLAEGKSATVRNNKVDNNAGSSSDGIYVYVQGTGGLMTIENNPVTKSGRRGIYLRGVRSGSTVANFIVHDSGSHGLRAEHSELEIENVTITDSGGNGIYFVHGKCFTIRNSTIDGNAGGIIYYDGASGDATVEDNTITNNIGSGVHIGLAEGKSATVRNNKIDNNAGGSSDGIYVNTGGSGGLMTIENNHVTKSGQRGIRLGGVRAGSTIANLTVHGSGSHGIRVDSSDVNIKNVTVTNSGGNGIYFVHGKGFTIRDCTIDGNAGGIIYYDAASGDAIVEDNTITNNVGSGVHIGLAEGKSATVRNNRIDNNAGSSSDGLYVNIGGSGGLMTIENNPVTKSGQRGIRLGGVRAGSTVANFIVHDSGSHGLRADYSDLEIENVTVTNSGGNGIYFVHGKGFTIRNSTLDGNAGGIIYYDAASGDAVVEDNVITNNIGSGVHIGLAEGKSATVRNNRIDNNAGSSSDGIYVNIAGSGGLMTIEGNPVTDSGRRGIALTGVKTGSTIANFTVHGSGSHGIRADYSDVNIENVTITESGNHGIYFVHGKGFTIRGSTITGNAGGIIYYDAASGDATVEDSIITNNVGSGVHIGLAEGKSATVRNNKIDNNAGGSSDGIYVHIASIGGVATIKNNLVENSGRYGIYLTGATNSTVVENTISINYYGMCLYSSPNNSIFHNNFIDNINYNAHDNRDSNSWDDGYPSGGNYWGDDYPGTDADGDGIGDESYDISGGAGAQDRYPLMQMWNITPPPDPIPAIDSDGDGVPDAWDDEPDTPAGYWTDSHGLGRRWGDMNGDGKLTSADALMIMQAAAGSIEL